MIDRLHLLPVSKQAAALGISRRSVYYLSRPTLAADLALTRVGRDRFGRTLALIDPDTREVHDVMRLDAPSFRQARIPPGARGG